MSLRVTAPILERGGVLLFRFFLPRAKSHGHLYCRLYTAE